jgi:hypothetical protein
LKDRLKKKKNKKIKKKKLKPIAIYSVCIIYQKLYTLKIELINHTISICYSLSLSLFDYCRYFGEANFGFRDVKYGLR